MSAAVTDQGKSYVICSNPRSGTTRLAFLLASTGRLGIPFEWIRGDKSPAHFTYSEYPTSADEQLNYMLTDGTSSNGISGLKMFPEHFDACVDSHWANRLPNLHFIYMTREDILGQAISLAMARQTFSYTSWNEEKQEPVYDRKQIKSCLEFIALGEARWRLFFALNGIFPLHVTYEEMIGDPQGVIDRIAGLMGVAGAVIDWTSLQPEMQRRQRSNDWRKCFIQDECNVTELPRLTDVTNEDTLCPPALFERYLASLAAEALT